MPSFQFFLGVFSEIQKFKVFSVFPTWLPHHVTYDVIIIIKTFHISRRSNDENFVSIRNAVAQKNTEVLCRQTNTNKQAGRRRWPDPSTLYFTPGIAEISKSKIKKKIKI